MSSIPASLNNTTLKLSTGRSFPRLAFGTGTQWFKTQDGSSSNAGAELKLESALHTALDAGFRHIDEAEMYGTQELTGPALEKWMQAHPDVKREDLFITSKIWRGMTNPRQTVTNALKALQTPYLDLYLVHAPFLKDNGINANVKTVWSELEVMKEEGLIKDLGVSNFALEHLEDMLSWSKHKPVVNQIECNPHLLQPELEAYCAANNIIITSYSPLAPFAQKHEPTLALVKEIAQKHHLTPGQILLQWNLAHGHGVITTSSKPEHINESAHVLDGPRITEEDVEAITSTAATRTHRIFWRSSFGLSA
eukprot:gene4578-8575_t